MNVLQMLESFVEIHIRAGGNRKDQKPPKRKELIERFKRALGDLKYMGYLSESNKGSYLFKKNYFAKNKVDV